ncbi:hypothetical protein DXG01_011619 [Tephrocybe rancida]|nr:hypothetical protein DXG01_011619 [Tephrocybe rancida]
MSSVAVSISKIAEVTTSKTPTSDAPVDVLYDISAIYAPQLDSIPQAGILNTTPSEASPVVVDKMTDDEILTLISKSSSLDLHDHSYTRLIAPNIIAKKATDGQAVPSEFLALQQNEKTHVAKMLHNYVLQLRTLRHDVPGPPAPGREARVCTESSLFGGVVDTRGPFPSYRALSDFFNKRQRMTLDPSNWGPGPQCTEPFDDSFPLVLTHKRIGLQNLVKGDDGRLWVRDWGCAGFYPEWFEYACMKQQAENLVSIRKGKDGCGGSDEAWDQFVETVCCGEQGGRYKKQYEWYKKNVVIFKIIKH